MDSLKLSLVVVSLALIVGCQVGSAIQCYKCNSNLPEQKDCIDNPDKYLIDCAELSQETGLNYTMCRKYDQTVEGDHAIDRDCAVEGSGRCILRTGTKEIKLEYCECEGDKCNTATQSVASVSALLSMIASALLALIMSS